MKLIQAIQNFRTTLPFLHYTHRRPITVRDSNPYNFCYCAENSDGENCYYCAQSSNERESRSSELEGTEKRRTSERRKKSKLKSYKFSRSKRDYEKGYVAGEYLVETFERLGADADTQHGDSGSRKSRSKHKADENVRVGKLIDLDGFEEVPCGQDHGHGNKYKSRRRKTSFMERISLRS
ncbi:hypothetical protein BKA69DRAFT_1038321 [Paraphysoderma sedebokerense]|nr:hypothetical protein BKA69DRAFT_1038321 [Paraphysoderma sedebokerense]